MKAEYVLINGQYVSAGKARSMLKQNPHLALGGLGNTEPQPNAIPPLVKEPKTFRSGKARMAIVVTIISHRRKLVDEDNLIGGAKSLRDSIARSLALDDADRRITWEYRQLVTQGRTGTHVCITHQ